MTMQPRIAHRRESAPLPAIGTLTWEQVNGARIDGEAIPRLEEILTTGPGRRC